MKGSDSEGEKAEDGGLASLGGLEAGGSLRLVLFFFFFGGGGGGGGVRV